MTAAAALALAASLCWGLSDFLGGNAATNQPLAVVLAVSQIAGALGVAPLLVLHDAPAPDAARLVLGGVAGVVAVAELSLIYLALRRGPSVVIAPIAALAALLPVAVGLADGDPVTALTVAGIACALSGAAFASWSPSAQRRPRARVLGGAAVGAGAALGTGIVLVLFERASEGDAYWATAAMRAGGLTAALIILGGRALRGRGRPVPSLAPRAALALAAVGAADLTADVAYATATRTGALSVVAVLASLYPVVVVVLGIAILRERPRTIQLAGALVACTGIGLLAQAG